MGTGSPAPAPAPASCPFISAVPCKRALGQEIRIPMWHSENKPLNIFSIHGICWTYADRACWQTVPNELFSPLPDFRLYNLWKGINSRPPPPHFPSRNPFSGKTGRRKRKSSPCIRETMVKSPEQEHPQEALGWAARDPSGLLSPFKFSRRFFLTFPSFSYGGITIVHLML